MARARKQVGGGKGTGLAGSAAPQMSPRPAGIRADECFLAARIDDLEFATTDDIEPLESVIEQDRALASLELGLSIRRSNYHVYLSGPTGTGKRSQLKALLARIAPTRKTPGDRVYVHNFADENAPCAIALTPGQGVRLRKDIDALLAHLLEELPKAFHAPDHQDKLQRALHRAHQANTEALRVLTRSAAELGFDVRTNGEGEIAVRPVFDGHALDPDDVVNLPDESRLEIDRRRVSLDPTFRDFFLANRKADLATREALKRAQNELGESVARKPFRDLKRRYRSGGASLRTFLDLLYADVVGRLERFMPDEESSGDDGRTQDPFVAFRVNVIVDNSGLKGAPVIFDNQPNFYRMFGKIERRVEQGIYFTDHTMIRGGSMQQANGGFLVVHAADLLTAPGVWDALKSSIRNGEVPIVDLGETAGLLPTSGLKPEPIPLDVKLVLIGTHGLFHMLYEADEDFRKMFHIRADFDQEIRRTSESVHSYVRFIATAARNNGCRPIDRGGVSAVIEEGSRLVGSQRKLTLRFNEISSVLVEANFHAERDGDELIGAAHVARALADRNVRSGLLADKMHQDMLDGMVLLEASGSRVGVINGMAVLQSADHEFGRPFRITARCFAGQAGIVNIEHEAQLSGEIHDKGVQITAGFLGENFASRRPLALTATVTFEQSYGLIDGDSASSTWLYAILSHLADVPISQGIGVTGSVNQIGEIQPVGGLNEKIEGFFRFCQAKGLDGSQGVLIPDRNIANLMLSAEVREAIEADQFHVWPVGSIADGIAILTGVVAGALQPDGTFPEGSLMRRVADRLDELRAYADTGGSRS